MRPFPAEKRLLWSMLAAAAVLFAGSAARAQKAPMVRAEAQPQLDRALRHYQAKEYADAAAACEAAYAIDSQPDLLYMWAQARRLAGDCAAALPIYRRYLDTNPSAREADLARKNIVRCESPPAAPAAPVPTGGPPAPSPPAAAGAPLLASSTATARPTTPTARVPAAPMPPPATAPAATLTVTAQAPAPATPWHRNTFGHVLTGSGLALGGAAAVLNWSARTELGRAREATVYDQAVTHAEAAGLRSKLALGALVAGSALVVAGIVRYVASAW